MKTNDLPHTRLKNFVFSLIVLTALPGTVREAVEMPDVISSPNSESTFVAAQNSHQKLPSTEATYTIIASDFANKTLRILADLPIEDGSLSIGEHHPEPEGIHWGDFVSDLKVVLADGSEVETEKVSFNRWRISDGIEAGRFKVSYEVTLGHDEYDWPPSLAEATYVRSDVIFARTYAILIASRAVESATIRFDVPASWDVTTPLPILRSDSRIRFADNRFCTYSTGIMMGLHENENLTVNGIDLEIGVAADLPGAMEAMREPFQMALREATDLFGGAPAGRYAILAAKKYKGPPNSQAGSGLGNGMSVLFGRNPADNPGGYWAYTFIHELMHMWTGGVLRNRNGWTEEWFSEGFSDYLTMVIAGRTGVPRQSVVLYHLGAMWSGYQTLAGEISMANAGAQKSRYYNFIYGGGLHVALLLDIELRKASDGTITIIDLMQNLYSEFGISQKNLTTIDIKRVANSLVDRDLSWIFDDYVTGTGVLSYSLIYPQLGIVMSTNAAGRAIFVVDDDAPESAVQLRKNTLGLE